MKPLYIWAGGKNKMLKHYESELKALHDFDTFVEPFFGGGAMTIHIYENFKDVKRFVINDIKPEIIRIYESIKSDCDRFLELMDEYDSHFMPMSKERRKEYYYEVRLKHAYEYESMTPTEEAACLYFLLRTCFNGVWQINQNTNGRFGTPSGLLDQKVSIYEKSNVKEWNAFLQNADLHTGDWKEVSKKYLSLYKTLYNNRSI